MPDPKCPVVSVKIKSIITYANGETKEFELAFDDAWIEMERGVAYDRATNGYVHKIILNGQERMTIKAWKGCRSYEDFTTERCGSLPNSQN